MWRQAGVQGLHGFVSYAREDAVEVELLATLLAASGYSCRRDRNLTSGARYRKETEAERKTAVGRDENRLAAISFDGSMPLLGFRQFQVTDFSRWKGGADEAPSPSLVSALARLARAMPSDVSAGPPLGKRR